MHLAILNVSLNSCLEDFLSLLRSKNSFLYKGRPQLGFPRWLSGRESACQAGDTGSIPWSGRSPGEGNGNPLQYSCLENPKDRGAWRAIVHRGHRDSDTTKETYHTYIHIHIAPVVWSLRRVQHFCDATDLALQAPLSVGFPRQ